MRPGTARRAHRMLGALLLLPFLVWTGTGLLFLVKPGWRGAYELLDPFRPEALALAGVVPPSALGVERAARVELAGTALGPVYRVTDAGGARRLLDARSGAELSPLARDAALAVALDAASRAAAPARYGAVDEVTEDAREVVIRFAGGARVRVGRDDLALAQDGPDTARIERLYRLHYLRWTGVEALDRALVLVAIAATWALAGLGIRLLRRRDA